MWGIKPNLRIPEPSVIGPVFISKKKKAKYKRWLAGAEILETHFGRRYRGIQRRFSELGIGDREE